MSNLEAWWHQIAQLNGVLYSTLPVLNRFDVIWNLFKPNEIPKLYPHWKRWDYSNEFSKLQAFKNVIFVCSVV